MSSYVDAQLLPEEEVLHRASVHWIVYAPAAFLGAFAIVCPFIGVPALPTLVFAAIAGVYGLLAWLQRRTTELAVTDRRVIAKFGFVRRMAFEQQLGRVDGVDLEQGILGRLLGFANVGVRGAGGASVPVPCIADAEGFKRAISERLG